MGRTVFDYAKLKGRITEKFGCQKVFAERLEITPSVLSLKLAGKNPFSQEQIYRAIDALEISPDSITEYFFTPRVHKCEQQ